MVATIPWEAIEEKYAELFPSDTGMPAKPLRMALGSLMIQKQYGYVIKGSNMTRLYVYSYNMTNLF